MNWIIIRVPHQMIKMNIGDNYDWFFKEVEVYVKYSGNCLSSIRLVCVWNETSR